jgi:potassium efflux system protein
MDPGAGAAADVGGKPEAHSDAAAERAETIERLKRLTQSTPPDAVSAAALNKPLREVLEERLHWLDEWDKTAKARREAEHPDAGTERQSADVKADLERVKVLLEQSARDSAALLPAVFRAEPREQSDASRAEMKDAIETSTSELNDWKKKLEKARAETAKQSSTLAPLRAERDKIHQRVAALKGRQDERQAALAAAKTSDEVELARERLVNFQWESRVETERLEIQEALLASNEGPATERAALDLQLIDAHVQLATRTLERMQRRYGLFAALQERNLQQAAASEQKRADRADDPLEKYRARRRAELLELTAQVLKFENALTTNPTPSLDEQRTLADRADREFAEVRALIDDGKVSHLDALRLSNDFRRIGPERTRIVGHELAAAGSQLTAYENVLSSVEMDLINDSRDDRLQHEDLLERLPKPRHAEALALCQQTEAVHLQLLERKRVALEKLAQRAEQTYAQIERRLKTLDDQYGFIRTYIFCVRDQEPIGAVTVAQARRELALLGRSLLVILRECGDRSFWGRVSPEFAVSALALLGMPWPLFRLRRSICQSRTPAPAAMAASPR